MVTQENKRKIKIYGTNFLTPSLIGFLQHTPKIAEAVGKIPHLNNIFDKVAGSANPYGAIGFGALDMVGKISPKIKNSKFTRFAHLGGAAFYGGQTVLDLLSVASGEYKSLVDVAFDASMAYQLGKDMFKNYAAPKDLWDDITKW